MISWFLFFIVYLIMTDCNDYTLKNKGPKMVFLQWCLEEPFSEKFLNQKNWRT